MDTLATLSIMERIMLLRRAPLFVDLQAADLKQIAQIATERFYADGERIAQQGEIGDEMYIIMSGQALVMYEPEEGQRKLLARRQPGEAVGEMAILSQEPRMASLYADGDARVLAIGRREFEGILRERPDTALAVMRVLCARLRE